jgi:hypothetical protein
MAGPSSLVRTLGVPTSATSLLPTPPDAIAAAWGSHMIPPSHHHHLPPPPIGSHSRHHLHHHHHHAHHHQPPGPSPIHHLPLPPPPPLHLPPLPPSSLPPSLSSYGIYAAPASGGVPSLFPRALPASTGGVAPLTNPYGPPPVDLTPPAPSYHVSAATGAPLLTLSGVPGVPPLTVQTPLYTIPPSGITPLFPVASTGSAIAKSAISSGGDEATTKKKYHHPSLSSSEALASTPSLPTLSTSTPTDLVVTSIPLSKLKAAKDALEQARAKANRYTYVHLTHISTQLSPIDVTHYYWLR